MKTSGDRLQAIIAEHDAHLSKLEDRVIERVNSALESSYKRLEKQLLTTYPKIQANDSLLATQRSTLILSEVTDLLALTNSRNSEQIYQQFEGLLKTSNEVGGSLASELTQAIADRDLQQTAGVPVDALRFAAENAVKRLSRHNEEFREKASAIVSQSLIQNWGVQKAARYLRQELGVTKGKAEQIIRTETISATDEAARANYKANGIDYVQRVATQDRRTCPFCVARAGHVYPVDKAPAAIHPNDRCYNMPWMPEWEKEGLIDTAWMKRHRDSVLAELKAQGKEPNNNIAPFERSAKLTEPVKPVWTADAGFLNKSLTKTKPKSEPKPKKAADFPSSLDKLEPVRSLGGSTGAKLVRDPATGKQYVLKKGNSPDHLREEMAADAAYQALGVPVPKFKGYETQDGPVKLAEFIEGKSLSEVLKAGGKEADRVKKEIQKHFAADALLGNWDVVGMEMDNVLVGKDGKVYRIDNGGSLRYRAQGELKGDRWNNYPTELWSLRRGEVNEQTTQVFGQFGTPGALGHFEIMDQVKDLAGKRESLLKALPKELQATIRVRLSEMERLSSISQTLQADKWKESYISGFTRNCLELRADGIVDKFPKELRQKGNGVTVIDENKKEFDNLRGKGSTMEALRDFVNANGGNYSALESWMSGQAGSSWSGEAQALKYLLSVARDVPTDTYYWHKGYAQAKENFTRAAKESGGSVTYLKTFAAWHAFNYELMDAVDFDRRNAATKTIELMRTESSTVMALNDLTPGQTGITMKRGAAESTSIYKSVEVYGSELTVQQVPYHRVIGAYFYERRPGQSGTAFMGDKENEFVCMLDDIPFDYVKPSKSKP